MREGPALYLRQVNPIANQALNPIFIILKGQIQDKSTGMGHLLFKLIVDQIQDVLLFNRHSFLQLSQDVFFNRKKAVLQVAVFIGLRRVFLEELSALEEFLDHALDADVNKVVFFAYCFC